MPHMKMKLNLPMTVNDARYLDCMPGEYGPQLRIKGTIEGEQNSVLYLPGKVWAARKSLVEAGVIGEEAFDEEPTEAVNIPLLKTEFVLTNQQVTGKNYRNIAVATRDGTQKPPQATKAHNTGPLLPGEEEGYVDALAGQPDGAYVTLGISREVPITESQKDKVERMYLESLRFVVNRVVPVWEAGKISYDAGDMNAAVATLMIQRGGR
jgi:hypothetical protein